MCNSALPELYSIRPDNTSSEPWLNQKVGHYLCGSHHSSHSARLQVQHMDWGPGEAAVAWQHPGKQPGMLCSLLCKVCCKVKVNNIWVANSSRMHLMVRWYTLVQRVILLKPQMHEVKIDILCFSTTGIAPQNKHQDNQTARRKKIAFWPNWSDKLKIYWNNSGNWKLWLTLFSEQL